MAGFAEAVRGHGFAEPVARHFRRTNSACRDQRHDALQMRPIASDVGPQRNDIGAIESAYMSGSVSTG